MHVWLFSHPAYPKTVWPFQDPKLQDLLVQLGVLQVED